MTSFSDSDKQEIRECLSAVNEQEIKGWVAMKANDYLATFIYELIYT